MFLINPFWYKAPIPSGLGYRYGYEFDGVDEEISFPNYDISGHFSVSVWFKLIDSGNNVMIGDWGSGTRSWLLRTSSGKVQFFTSEDGIANNLLQTTLTYNDNSWHNVLITFGSTGGKRIYIDGSLVASVSTYYVVYNSSNNLLIGEYAFGGNNFNGRLDDVQLYDFELNATQVSDIYNSGYVTAPTASPIHHWKLGEEDTFSTNWTVKDSVGSLDGTSVNMEEVDRKLGVAYSLDFDGVDEYIDFGNIFDNDGSQSMYWSFWFKKGSSNPFLSKINSADGYAIYEASNALIFKIGTAGSNQIEVRTSSLVTSSTDWYHAVVCYQGDKDATTVKIYINGVESSIVYRDTFTTDSSNTSNFVIGVDNNWTATNLTGRIMYLSKFDNEPSASDVALLYNTTGTNNGVPIDPRDVGLNPTFFAPLGGENDTFSTNWTFVDEINANNGTSVNMEEADKTSETP